MQFAGIIILLCPPFILLAAALVALGFGRQRYAMVFGLLSAASAIALAFLVWYVYALWNPTPHHFRDVDHFPDVAGIGDWTCQLRKVPVDHVYFYNTRTLRSTQYLRCHIIHKEDFERYREMYRRNTDSQEEPLNKTNAEIKSGMTGREYESIRSWWDWSDRPDCDLFRLGEDDFLVFDTTRNIVFIYRTDG